MESGQSGLNLAKHEVAFEEAMTVFADPLARILTILTTQPQESREIIVGHSADQRLLMVSFTTRRDSVRIFSARKVTRRERRDYEENVIR